MIATSASRDYQIKDWLAIPGIQEALTNQTTQGVAKGILSHDDRLYINRPVTRNGRVLGAVRMSVTLQQFQNQFARLVWAVFGALLLTVLLCAVISDRIARSLAKPLARAGELDWDWRSPNALWKLTGERLQPAAP